MKTCTLSGRKLLAKLSLFNACMVIWWIGLCALYLSSNPEEVHRIKHSTELYSAEDKVLLEQQSCVRNAGPCPRLNLNRSDDYLVDLPGFEYLLNTASCNSKESVVVLIHSACAHFAERKSIRSSWGNSSPRLRGFVIKLVFLLARTNDSAVQEQIQQEHKWHKDIVQGELFSSSSS